MPALDQCPLNGRERYLRQLQNLLLATPDSADVRRRYYELLAGPIPPDERRDIACVVRAEVAKVMTNQEQVEHVRRWARRIVKFLYAIRWYR